MTLFGQATLAGRRLLEAGAQVVTVIWDEYGPANSAWDTHFYHYERLQRRALARPRLGAHRPADSTSKSAACSTTRS